MTDQNLYPNPEEMSLDALIEETKQQIDAAPGELDAMPEEAYSIAQEQPLQMPLSEEQPSIPVQEQSQSVIAPQEEPAAQELDFMPDFGDAFSDYGVYEQPLQQDVISYGEYEEYDNEEEEAAEDDVPPPEKPKRKTGKRFIPLFVKILLYVVIVGVISIGLGYGAWECAKDVLAFGRSDEKVTVVVNDGDTVEDIAKMLQEKGIIKYPWLFEFYCSFTDSSEKMDPGTYDLYYNYDYNALVSGMIKDSPARVTVRVMIPEGYTAAQIFSLMEKNDICSVEELESCAANYEFDYWFLEGIPYGAANRLEGFLFPDTYDFYENDDPERVLDKLLTNFNKKFSEEAQVRLDELNAILAERLRNAGYDEVYIADHALTVYELMTVASMIEKETAAYDESADISSVIYNRLCRPGDYPYLNIDATVVYALGGSIDGALTYEDTQVDSPYNTYLVVGLPAGPISNPGLSNISAALYPSDTNYYYYALDRETGYHHFSSTYDEHNQFLEGQNDAD